MQFFKHVCLMVMSSTVGVLLFGAAVFAIEAGVPPTPTYGPVFITALQTSTQLDFVELHNETETPIDMSGWVVEVQGKQGANVAICQITLSDWALGGTYITLAREGVVNDASGNVRLYSPCVGSMENVSKVTLMHNGATQEEVTPTTGAFVRKGETKTYRTGVFSKDFVPMAPPNRTMLYAEPWYAPAESNLLQFNEILSNARDCSPADTAADCGDYVKLYNPTSLPVDLSNFRLRNGYQGQNPTPSNTFSLYGVIQPGQLATITHSSDNRPLVLTNSGGFVWLEDTHGIKRYDNTIQNYADASADSKKGKSWAYDVNDGTWKWGVPMPGGINMFITEVEATSSSSTSSLVPCKPGQYRSEETNRCRNIATAESSLVPCKEGQYRSEETNRCRSATAANSLTPCKEGQERNPATNRCRNVASQVPNAAFAVEPLKDTGTAFAGWWALGGVGLLALGYAVWEWRDEIRRGIQKAGSFFTSKK